MLCIVSAAPKEISVVCQEMLTTGQGIAADNCFARVETTFKNPADQTIIQGTPASKSTQGTPAPKSRAATQALLPDNSESGFSSEIFVRVMEKCFSKESVHAVVDKCVEAEKEAFQILEKTRAKPRAERLRLLSTCRPVGCETVADLFRWLVQVQNIYFGF
jgi:hypothetical protein